MTDDPPRSRHRRWTAAEDGELARRLRAREPIGTIAADLGRTVDGLRGRAQLLRLTLPSRLRPWRFQIRAGVPPAGQVASRPVADDGEPVTDVAALPSADEGGRG